MPSVHIKSPRLSTDQKKRIGDRVISALHSAGFASGSVVVFFEREDADLLLDGGLLFEVDAKPMEAPPPEPPPPPPAVFLPPPPLEPAADFKQKPRRSKGELLDLKAQLLQS